MAVAALGKALLKARRARLKAARRDARNDEPDLAGDYLAANPDEMTSEQIQMAITNAEYLGLPGWRVNDLKKQLPISLESDKANQMLEARNARLNEVAIGGRESPAPPKPSGPAYDPDPLVDWPTENIFSGPVREPAAPSLSTNNSTRNSRRRGMRSAPWANQSEIDRIYDTAKELSGVTGVPHEVDHVIPLLGDYVSGLHHQDNLLIMPKFAHKGKSNKFDVGDDPMRMNDVAKKNAISGNSRHLEQNGDLIQGRIKNKAPKSAIESAALDSEIDSRIGHLSRLARALRNGRHYGQGE